MENTKIEAFTGISSNEDPFEAGKESVESMLAGLEEEPKIVFVFSSSEYDQEEVLSGVISSTEEARVVGCSTAGEIEGSQVKSGSVVVMGISGADHWPVAVEKGAVENSFRTGREMARKLRERENNFSALFLLGDGLSENGAEIVRGAQEVLGNDFLIIGGLAGDDYNFQKTFQYVDGEVVSGAVLGIGISDDVSFGTGCGHGWEPVGNPMRVTASEGAKVIEIENEPALKIYEDYFGKAAEELTRESFAQIAYTYPLGMSIDESENTLLRSPVIANGDGEIDFAAEVPEGSIVRLMIGDRKKAIGAAREAAESARNQLGEKPKAVFVFNCIARYKLLGMERNEELEAIKDVFGPEVPVAGFYTYGEIAPLKNGEERSVFHNETITVLAIR